MQADIIFLIEIVKYLCAVLVGVLAGNGAVYFFNAMPASWFCDYGEKPTPEMLDSSRQRVTSYPWKYTLSMLFVAIGLYLVKDDWVYAIAVVVIMWLLVLLSMADIKFRIVPDQLLVLVVVSSFGIVQYHSSWRDMLAGAVAGLGIMGVTAVIGKLMYKRDAVGGGDIKLFTALGLIAGLYGIVSIFIVTALISAAHMIYLLAKKRIKRTDTFPMVPYIAVATGIYLIFLHTRIEMLFEF